MQDHNSTGVIFIGPPGCAKSAIAKAAGNEAEIPTITFDLSGMKASLVGESERRMSMGLNIVTAVSQGRALFVATCNSIEALPPELRRRYTFGTFFFDLPDEEERMAIWRIYLHRYDLPAQPIPVSVGWTGAEIKMCCELAWRMDTDLIEASSYIVPVAQSAPDRIQRLRDQANNRFISASYPGLYQHGKAVVREVEPLGDGRGDGIDSSEVRRDLFGA